jgi:HD-GYP domain-containing protein (c-di-GMP phosphodiesterase class II)
MSQPDANDPLIPGLPTQANPHYLRALSSLAEEKEVQVAEDVYSQSGIKLLARGARVTAGLYDQVIKHRLRSPLETSLTSVEGLDTSALARTAEQALDETPLLRGFCNWSQGRVTPIGMLEHLHFSPQACTLLAVAERRAPTNRAHHVRVALITMGLANAWRYNDARLLASMGIAGMFHDIGDLYVDPALSQSGHEMTTREWMSFSSHPIIGAALAREVAGLDKVVQSASTAVAIHAAANAPNSRLADKSWQWPKQSRPF